MKKITTFIFLLATLFALNVHIVLAESKAEEEPWSKYPDNSAMNFQDVDSFYDSLDKKWYVEFEQAKN